VLGIDTMQEIIDLSFNYGIIPHTGGGYYQHPTFPLDKKGLNRLHGKDAAVEFLQANPDAREQVRLELMELARGVVAEEDKVEV
jgi:hypothetical protein